MVDRAGFVGFAWLDDEERAARGDATATNFATKTSRTKSRDGSLHTKYAGARGGGAMTRGWTSIARAADLAQLWGSLPEWLQRSIRTGLWTVLVLGSSYIWSRFSSLPWELLIVFSAVLLTAFIWSGAGIVYVLRMARVNPASTASVVTEESDHSQADRKERLSRLKEYLGEGKVLHVTIRQAAQQARPHDQGSILTLQQSTRDMEIWRDKVRSIVSQWDIHEAQYFMNCSSNWAPPARMACFVSRLEEVIGKLERRC